MGLERGKPGRCLRWTVGGALLGAPVACGHSETSAPNATAGASGSTAGASGSTAVSNAGAAQNNGLGVNPCPDGGADFGESVPPSGTFTQVSAGLHHSCGVRTDGTVACWGAGTSNGDC
ncbi:MAG: RCC1 domain-containing protein [Pseudomonadota bacterium]